MTAQQSRAIAALMDRLPPQVRKHVQVDILRGKNESEVVMEAINKTYGEDIPEEFREDLEQIREN